MPRKFCFDFVARIGKRDLATLMVCSIRSMSLIFFFVGFLVHITPSGVPIGLRATLSSSAFGSQSSQLQRAAGCQEYFSARFCVYAKG